MSDYVFQRAVSTPFVDRSNQIVNGFTIYVEFPDFDEVHTFNVPDIEADTIDETARTFLEKRRTANALGESVE